MSDKLTNLGATIEKRLAILHEEEMEDLAENLSPLEMVEMVNRMLKSFPNDKERVDFFCSLDYCVHCGSDNCGHICNRG